jgi:hypothetical protein
VGQSDTSSKGGINLFSETTICFGLPGGHLQVYKMLAHRD